MIRALLLSIVLFYITALTANERTLPSVNESPWRPPIQLATELKGPIDITDYLVSEKFDGIRGYWTGVDFYTRSGKPISVPTWFSEGFPAYPLDGEFWLGRGNFHKMLSVIKQTQADPKKWQSVRFMVFDLPASKAPFEERYTRMLSSLTARSPYLNVISQVSVDSQVQLDTLLDEVLAKGGEGLMLHHKEALYKVGRSSQIMKLKPLYTASAKVVGYQAGKGRFKGMMGALVLQLPTGQEFKLGTGFNDAQRSNPPKIGSQVSYEYRGLTHNGIPRFASFIQEETDKFHDKEHK
ncbi:DNA ligase [uncultured Shewanella sp.]|uniref:DNA ligase n=1 Tax=uncultured Shewanella sp. TaxID=173975 RepID=UPI00263219EB|nr:DNA ligase [uncultured Shewanella sp.]